MIYQICTILDYMYAQCVLDEYENSWNSLHAMYEIERYKYNI